MNPSTLQFILLGVTVFLFVFGVYKTWMEKSVSAKDNIESLRHKRTEYTSSSSTADGTPGKPKAPAEILKKRDKTKAHRWAAKMETRLERGNLLIRPQEFLMMQFVVAFVLGLLGFFLGGQNILVALGGLILGFFGPDIFLNLRTWLRMSVAEEQFPDVLDSMVNCFKTGYGFNRAVQMVSENYDDPWGTEFGKMTAEVSLGASQEEALNNLAKRMPSPDVDLFVTAMLIQKETGGNMSELLGKLSSTCRERFKLIRKVSAISAQGKLSACIVSLIPLIIMAIMSVFLSEPVEKFVTNPIGIILLVIAGAWMALGVKVLFNIVNIKV